MVESGVSCTRSEERYLGHYPAVTSAVSSSTSHSSLEASVWQQYRYYQSQFYRHQQYLPYQYPPHQYPGTDDTGSVEPPAYHSPSWLHPHASHHNYSTGVQHQQSQPHLADRVGITPPVYHHFREMNGVCYDSVY